MSEYENRIFDTLTSNEDKFKSAIEIANHISSIKTKLIEDYWHKVKKELESLVEENNEEFKVGLDSKVFNVNSKCYLYLNNNKKARFQFERLSSNQSFGLWFESPEINVQKVKDYWDNLENEISGYSFTSWWFAYKAKSDDFSNVESMIRILPDASEEYSKQRALELFEFAVDNKEHLKYIINNCLKENE